MNSQPRLQNDQLYVLHHKSGKNTSSLPYALKLAAQLRCSASLLSYQERAPTPALSMANSIFSPLGVGFFKDQRSESKPSLNAHHLSRANSNIWEQLRFDLGKEVTQDQILDLIQQGSPSLLVLEGCDPLHQLEERLGTFDIRLANATEVPVLTVPPGYVWKEIKKLLFVLDAEDAEPSMFTYIRSISTRLNAQLEVILISEDAMGQSEIDFLTLRESLVAKFPDIQFILHKAYGEDRADKVKELINSSRANWLVVKKQTNSIIERLFGSFHSQKIIHSSPIPCLLI